MRLGIGLFVTGGGSRLGGGASAPTLTKNCAGQLTAVGGGPAAPSVTKNNAGQITAVGT